MLRPRLPLLLALLCTAACGAPEPPSRAGGTSASSKAVAAEPIFRYVQLGPGRVVLGQRVPDTILTALDARAGDTIVPLPRGTFGGADRITLYLTPAGILRGAVFDHPHGADVEVMVRDYATTLGAPRRTTERRAGEEPASVATWADSRTTLVLRRDPNRNAWTVRSELWDRAEGR